MPLSRYKIPNEYRLANPDLYREAAKDDPNGLLEGVAMAGFAGIVRQLGELAEFAAEVFYDLHKELLATAAKGCELMIRVEQLEAELPVVEKFVMAEIDQVKFAYSPGTEWHANICNFQNNFSQGDLPQFIRDAYECCRGPPKLFLLDKFDAAGAGACLMRYTNPSFFKMKLGTSEIPKATKEHQMKRPCKIKKKEGEQERSGKISEGGVLYQMHPWMHYMPVDVDNMASTSSVYSHLNSGSKTDSTASVWGKSVRKGGLQAALSELLSQPEMESIESSGDTSVDDGNMNLNDDFWKPARISSQEREAKQLLGKAATENHKEVAVQENDFSLAVRISKDTDDDAISETDIFMDALTTLDFEVETDSEFETNSEADSDLNVGIGKRQSNGQLNQLIADELTLLDVQHLDSREKGGIVVHPAAENSKALERTDPILSTDTSSKPRISSVNQGYAFPSIQQIDTPVSLNKGIVWPSFFDNVTTSRSVGGPDSGSIDSVSAMSQKPELNDCDSIQKEIWKGNLLSSSHVLAERAIPSIYEGETVFPECIGSHFLHEHQQSIKCLNEEATRPMLERSLHADFESEAVESLRQLAPRSLSESIIQSTSWVVDTAKPQYFLDMADDIDAMQVLSNCPSLSSSTLSSPRPSRLATTVSHYGFESVLFHQESTESLSKSHSHTSCHSPISLLKHYSMLLSSSASNSENIQSGVFNASFPFQGAGFFVEPVNSPPLPPLPPPEWRSVRRHNSSLSNPLKGMKSTSLPSGFVDYSLEPDNILWTPRSSMGSSKDCWADSSASSRIVDNTLHCSSPLLPCETEGERFPSTAGSDNFDPEKLGGLSMQMLSRSNVEQAISFLSCGMHNEVPLDSVRHMVDLRPEVKSSLTPKRVENVTRDSKAAIPQTCEREVSLVEAISSYDQNKLKKVSKQSLCLGAATSDDRAVLLEEIRRQSFNLRHTKVEKHRTSQSIPNINVAAILEKANTIRQVFGSSDEDDNDEDDNGDDWSNTTTSIFCR